MFKLFEELPNSIVINGKDFEVDMSFDNILKILSLLKDNRLNEGAKVITAVRLLFKELPSNDVNELIEIWVQSFKALINPKEEEIEYDLKGNPMPKRNTPENEKCFDFEQDSEYIYASFLKDYKIDLFEQQGKLHWYKFNSLLNSLSEDTKLKKVIEIRQMEFPKGKENAKKRSEIRKLKKIYELKGEED